MTCSAFQSCSGGHRGAEVGGRPCPQRRGQRQALTEARDSRSSAPSREAAEWACLSVPQDEGQARVSRPPGSHPWLPFPRWLCSAVSFAGPFTQAHLSPQGELIRCEDAPACGSRGASPRLASGSVASLCRRGSGPGAPGRLSLSRGRRAAGEGLPRGAVRQEDEA